MAIKSDIREGSKINPSDSVNRDDQKITGMGGTLLQVKGVTVGTRAGKSLLSSLSFHIEPGELVTVTGPGGSGKSILLRALAGLWKPSKGEILCDGVNLYTNLKAFRPMIGFVPAGSVLPEHLTVGEILRDTARLRLPRAMANSDRQQRISALLDSMGFSQIHEKRIEALSKFEKRRLSIAIELLGSPGLLLIDEAADPLSPAEQVQTTRLLKELSRQGLTIIQVNQLSRCIELSDKVIILAPGGVLAWFGPPDEGIKYFQEFATGGNLAIPFGFEDVQGLLAGPVVGESAEWDKRYQAHSAYQKYVDDPLNNRYPDLLLQSQPLIRLRSSLKEKLPPASIPRASGHQKLFLLIGRNSHSLWRSKTAFLMFAIPPLVGLVDFILSSPTMSDPQSGDPFRLPVVLGLLIFLDLMVAALLVHTQIYKEKGVYRRVARTTSIALPYVFSKTWLVLLVALYQGIVWTLVHFAATGFYGGIQILPAYGITFFLVAFIGGMIGLIASALSQTPAMSIGWVLLLTIPQLFLSGSIIPLSHLSAPFKLLSGADPSRYGYETLLTASGYGQDIAADQCWQLPADQRNALSDTQKQSCTCMGTNIFSTCRFPGIQSYYSFAIEQPIPAEPTAGPSINNIPVQPVLKPGETVDQYAAEVNTYTSQLELYQGNYGAFVGSLRQYSQDLSNWQRTRSLVIGNAEGIISEAIDHYGQAFNVDINTHWLILVAMSLVLIVFLIGIQLGERAEK